MSLVLNLPTPDPLAQAHSEKLQQIIRAEIQANGPITFERFMHLALYYPGLGYYSAGAKKFGKTGDFITAPEISALFSRCIAKQCAQVLQHIKGDILEFGAGTGIMAKDILLELKSLNCLPEKYYILEISADLKQQQQNLLKAVLPDLIHRIVWLDTLPTESFHGVILANEVLDAMPVHKFKIKNGLKEYYIGLNDQSFNWHLDQPSHRLSEYYQKLNLTLSEDYQSEINSQLANWLNSINHFLQTGLLLMIDYGFLREEYYHSQRSMGTLMCHYKHRSHDNPLILIGLQDITAHINFTAVIDAGKKANMELAGFINQANFLINCGIIDLVEKTEDPSAQFQLSQQLKRLLFPSEMGELFKVLALTKDFAVPLLGFIPICL
jgi:SAM-dependent MidA family methyltransferase